MRKFRDQNFWANLWSYHLESYLATPARCGYWMASFLRNCYNYKVLEIAAGSCRDSRYLCAVGYRVVALDFDQKTLGYLAQRFVDSSLLYCVGDAFSLPFAEKSFDVSFSNGFWVCFDDDRFLHLLLREQARVTKKYLIAFVHNKDNDSLVRLFREKSLCDPIYDIRFFTRNELSKIVSESGISFRSISFYKFGGPADFLYFACLTKFVKYMSLLVPKLYAFQPWQRTERIVCVVELY